MSSDIYYSLSLDRKHKRMRSIGFWKILKKCKRREPIENLFFEMATKMKKVKTLYIYGNLTITDMLDKVRNTK